MGQLGESMKWCLTFVTGLVECLGFAGVLVGWPSLVYVLKREQYFAELCETGQNSTCPGASNATMGCTPQDERFTLIFTITSSVKSISMVINGFLLDYSGTMMTRFLAISLYTAATLMIAFSTAASAMILFSAVPFLGVGGLILLITNIQVANLFGRNRSTVITLYKGAYNSSSVVFLIVKVLYEAAFSLRSIFLSISCLSLLHIMRTVFLMPRTHIPYPLPEGYTYGATCHMFKLNALCREERSLHQSGSDRGMAGTGSEMMEESGGATAEGRQEDRQQTEEDLREGSVETEGGEREGRMDFQADMREGHGVGGGNSQLSGTEVSLVRDNQEQIPSFWNCVFSRLWLTHLLWFSLIQLRYLLFIGTLNPMLNLMTGGDIRKVSKFTNALAITQICAIFCAPWNGLILDRHKWRGQRMGSVTGSAVQQKLEDMNSTVLSLAITVMLSVLFSICAAIPVLEVQYLTFVLMVISVTFLYGSKTAFIAIAFPTCHFGKLYGTSVALAGVFSFLQYPCFILVKGPLQDNPLYMNVAFIALVTLAFVHPLDVHFWCRREYLMRSGSAGTSAELGETCPPTNNVFYIGDVATLGDSDGSISVKWEGPASEGQGVE